MSEFLSPQLESGNPEINYDPWQPTIFIKELSPEEKRDWVEAKHGKFGDSSDLDISDNENDPSIPEA